MVDPSIHKRLRGILGNQGVVTSPDEIGPYCQDASGIVSPPSAVLFPETTSHISQIVRLAHQERLAIAVRGGGTGLDGGAVAKRGEILLCLARMNRVLEISPQDLLAVVQPGITAHQLHQQLSDADLFYPVDPASWRQGTLGGDVATRAHGLRGGKYGPIRSHLLGLEAVISPGDIIQCGARTLKYATGYHLVDLLAGSQGRIGIITQIILKLQPTPQAKATLAATLKGLDAAVRLKEALRQNAIWPARLELLGSETSRFLCGELLPQEVREQHLLLAELDGPEDLLSEDAKNAARILAAEGTLVLHSTAQEGADEPWWQVRESLYSRLSGSGWPTVLLTSIVPTSATNLFYQKCQQAVREAACEAFFFGHLEEGRWHLVVRCRRDDGTAAEKLVRLSRAVQQTAASLSGNFLPPHTRGFGLKSPLVSTEDSGQRRIWKALKNRFDPLDIFPPLE